MPVAGCAPVCMLRAPLLLGCLLAGALGARILPPSNSPARPAMTLRAGVTESLKFRVGEKFVGKVPLGEHGQSKLTSNGGRQLIDVFGSISRKHNDRWKTRRTSSLQALNTAAVVPRQASLGSPSTSARLGYYTPPFWALALTIFAGPRILSRALVASAPRRGHRSSSSRLTCHASEKGESNGTTTTTVPPEKTEAEGEEEEPLFEEVSGDDPIVLNLEERLRTQNGNPDLTLDMVLNPGTIVNAEREVILLRAELAATPDDNTEERKVIEDKIEEKQMKIVNEMRQVMTDSLKLEFLLQAVGSLPVFASLCYGVWPWYPDLRWAGIGRGAVKLAFLLFGVWGVWLVTVPALRARKPGGPYGMGYEEKRALDISFLVLPFVCLITPIFSKAPEVTFWLSCLTLAGLYLWSFTTPLEGSSGSRRGAGGSDLPAPVQWAIRAIDFGTGSERGARSEDTTWQEQLAEYERKAQELAAAKKAKQ